MSWIELHQSVTWHKKTVKLGKALGCDRVAAIGHIVSLWLWALDAADDGDLTHLTDKDIAGACGWGKRPSAFVAGLLEAGYLDTDRKIHDWPRYAGRLIKQREDDADRKRKVRGQSGGTSDGQSGG